MSAPTEDEIDRAIEAWHAAERGENSRHLHEALGWSWAEYAAWVSNPAAIPPPPPLL